MLEVANRDTAIIMYIKEWEKKRHVKRKRYIYRLCEREIVCVRKREREREI